jgi:hypothetical protein
MDISAKERLRIMEEIIADAGGIENIDLHSELAKKLTTIRRQKVAEIPYSPVTAQGMMGNSSVLPTNPPVGGTISPAADSNATQGGNSPQIAQNTVETPLSTQTPPGM